MPLKFVDDTKLGGKINISDENKTEFLKYLDRLNGELDLTK